MSALGRIGLDAVRFGPDVLDTLVAAIDVNDLIDLNAPEPGSVRLDYPPDRFVEGFCLSRQLWQKGFDAPALTAFAARLRRGGTPDDEARRWFKQVRAGFKHLRFAFYLYDARHRSPPLLSLVTLVMGELQDATRVRGPREVARHAARLQWLLTALPRAMLVRETDRFVPSDGESFRRFCRAQADSIAPLLASSAAGAHDFHAARKVVSRQVSFHDDMRTLHPSAEHDAIARWLATLNGLMGKLHDDLVARDAAGAFRYKHDSFSLPGEIRHRLEAMVALYRGSSSS